MKKNQLALVAIHWILGVLMVVIVVWFLSWIAVCASDESACTFDKPASLLLAVGILNYVVWVLLTLSTYMLVKQWRSRYGASY